MSEGQILTTSFSAFLPFPFFFDALLLDKVAVLGAPPTLTPLPEADTPVLTPASLARDGRSVLDDSRPSAASRIMASPSLSLARNLELNIAVLEMILVRASGMVSEASGAEKIESAPGAVLAFAGLPVAGLREEGAGDASG